MIPCRKHQCCCSSVQSISSCIHFNHEHWELTNSLLFGACSVNDSVLNSPANPLLVVNQRLQQTMAQQRKQRTGQSPSPKLMLSGIATGTVSAGVASPKRGASARAGIGALSGRSALSASSAAAVVTGTSAGPAMATAVAGSLLMSPRSATAPSSAVRSSHSQQAGSAS
jgi:hypothetical protein